MRNNQRAVLPRWRDILTLIVLVALAFCNSPASAACNPYHGLGLIQSTYGMPGNFEVVAPASAGGMVHYGRDNSATTYYASPAGSGTVCSVLQPCSLQAAQSLVRAATPSMTGDLVVRLMSGTYRLTSTFTLDASARDTGTSGFRVVYEANPGAHPILSGGLAVTGWTPVPGTGQWSAPVPAGFNTRQLYVNGVRAVRAQGAAPGTLTRTATGYTSSVSTMASWGNRSDIEFVYDVAWDRIRCGVASITATTITMDQPCFDNSTKRMLGVNICLPTFVENARELLDQPGEWYLDRSTNTIFYMPRSSENMTTAQIEAANLAALLTGIGSSSAPLRNLTLRGLTFSYGGWMGVNGADGFSEVQANFRFTGVNAYRNQGTCNAVPPPPGSCPYGDWTPTPANVFFSGTDGLVLERNTFTHLGAVGLQLGAEVKNTTVVGNVFRDISANGMQVGYVSAPNPVSPDILPTDTTIINNWFTETGVEYTGSVGLFQGYTRRSLIQHNQVSSVPYSGISSGWGWGYHASANVGNVIRANLVFDHLLQRFDGGGIYTLGDQGPAIASGAVIDYNFVHGQRQNGHAIYTDAGSRYMTVSRNVMFDNAVPQDVGGCNLGPPTVMGDMVVSNNWWQHSPPSWHCAGLPPNVSVTGNVKLASANDAPSVIRETAGLEPSFDDIRAGAAIGFNLAYRRPAKALFFDGSPAVMQPGSEAEAAVDGDGVSYAQASNQWRWQLQVDLLDLQNVDRVKVTMPSIAFATALHVDTSADGASFTTAATRTGLTSGTTDISIAPTVARYIRVVADLPNGPNQTGGRMAISELAVYGRPDLALHKMAVAQFIDGTTAAMQERSLPSLAVDGIASTFAQASAQWRWQLSVDLGISRPVDRVIVAMPSDRFATRYHIDASTNGTRWTTVATILYGAGGSRAITFTSTTLRHLRVVADLPNGPNQLGGQMAISRLSVYGGANLAMSSAATAEFLDGSTATMQPFGAVGNALDGNPLTWAQATGQWLWRLRLDLGATQTLREVDVLMPAAAFATAFHVDTSSNGTAWTTIRSVTTVGVGGLVQVVLPSATRARYVRLVADLPNGPNQRGGQMGIAEVLVH